MTENFKINNTDHALFAALPPGSDGIHTLPESMTAAAFLGIAWFLCAEVNVRLLIRATRRSLYFWACLLCSWGISVHDIAIVLDNFNVWHNIGSLVVIEFSWLTFVVAQSVVLYSRLSLVLNNARLKRYVLYMILFNSVIFGLSTVVLGIVARHSPAMAARLGDCNRKWDKIQFAAFFAQEALIGLLYIRETRAHLKNMTLLGTDKTITRRNLRQLIAVNIFIIVLDCSLMGLCYSNYFFLQGFYKAAIYAVKLQTEFTILNQLRSSLPGGRSCSGQLDSGHMLQGNRRQEKPTGLPKARRSDEEDVEMMGKSEELVTSSKGEVC